MPNDLLTLTATALAAAGALLLAGNALGANVALQGLTWQANAVFVLLASLLVGGIALQCRGSCSAALLGGLAGGAVYGSYALIYKSMPRRRR